MVHALLSRSCSQVWSFGPYWGLSFICIIKLVKVADTNCSVSIAWRHRTSERLMLTEQIRKTWVAPESLFFHWYGKSLKFKEGQSGYYMAIYASGVSNGVHSHLLGVPTAPGIYILFFV